VFGGEEGKEEEGKAGDLGDTPRDEARHEAGAEREARD